MPMMIRSGRMQSSTAQPSLRNSGLEATWKSSAHGLPAAAWRRCAKMRSTVPTGEVDLLTISLACSLCAAMLSATANT
ncbi:hypothetical protein D3C86_2064520 [compost metagenome]